MNDRIDLAWMEARVYAFIPGTEVSGNQSAASLASSIWPAATSGNHTGLPATKTTKFLKSN